MTVFDLYKTFENINFITKTEVFASFQYELSDFITRSGQGNESQSIIEQMTIFDKDETFEIIDLITKAKVFATGQSNGTEGIIQYMTDYIRYRKNIY